MIQFEAMVAVTCEIDLSGLTCPLPVLRIKKKLGEMAPGEVLLAIVTDAGADEDVPSYLKQVGHRLLEVTNEVDRLKFYIEKA